jgi:Co/Zn/Cd efflux system component
MTEHNHKHSHGHNHKNDSHNHEHKYDYKKIALFATSMLYTILTGLAIASSFLYNRLFGIIAGDSFNDMIGTWINATQKSNYFSADMTYGTGLKPHLINIKIASFTCGYIFASILSAIYDMAIDDIFTSTNDKFDALICSAAIVFINSMIVLIMKSTQLGHNHSHNHSHGPDTARENLEQAHDTSFDSTVIHVFIDFFAGIINFLVCLIIWLLENYPNVEYLSPVSTILVGFFVFFRSNKLINDISLPLLNSVPNGVDNTALCTELTKLDFVENIICDHITTIADNENSAEIRIGLKQNVVVDDKTFSVLWDNVYECVIKYVPNLKHPTISFQPLYNGKYTKFHKSNHAENNNHCNNNIV